MKHLIIKPVFLFILSSLLLSCNSASEKINSPKKNKRSPQKQIQLVNQPAINPALLLLEAGQDASKYNYKEGIEKLERVLQITRENKNTDLELNALLMLGIFNFALDKYDRSIDYFQQRLTLLKTENQSDSAADATILFLGKAHYQQGDLPQALKYFQDLEKIAIEANDTKDLQSARLSLGNTYGAMGEYQKAIDYAEQILQNSASLEQDTLGDAKALMGTALWKSGKLSESETYLKQAYEAFELGRQERASKTNLAAQYTNLVNNEKDKIETFETAASTAALLQQVLIERNLPEQALEASEAGRARVTIDLLETKLVANSTPPVNTQDPINVACQYWNQTSHQLTPEQLKYIQQTVNCEQYGQEVKQSAAPTIEPPNIEEIKQVAQEQNITIVEYTIIRDNSFAKFKGKEDKLLTWVIQPTGKVEFEEINLADRKIPIEGLLVNWHRSLNRGASDKKILKELHKILINPIASYLPKDKDAEVVFIPHESIFLVPFAALRNWRGKYLIQRHTISTSPAIEFLALAAQQSQTLKQKGSTAQTSLIVGNPQMPGDLDPLPAAELEATEIGQILNTKPIIGNLATETSIREQISTSNVVHLATHALIEHDEIGALDIPGAIAFTPDASNDGWLTSSEIFDLSLNAELVVLSACDTGRGDIRSDGVIGLSRSFISAGSPSVLASLWEVPDNSTADLMTNFYQHWNGETNKAQALRQAMLKTMREYKDPLEWAAFTVIGESD